MNKGRPKTVEKEAHEPEKNREPASKNIKTVLVVLFIFTIKNTKDITVQSNSVPAVRSSFLKTHKVTTAFGKEFRSKTTSEAQR